MFDIVICDDQHETLKLIEKFIDNLLQGETYRLHSFAGASELLADNGCCLANLFILDICMPEIDGFQLAQSILLQNSMAKIIFLTSEADKVFDGYKYHAYRFVLKGDWESLKEGIQSALRIDNVNRIEFQTKNAYNEPETLSLNTNHIIYLEHNLRQLTAVTINGRVYIDKGRLTDFQKQLTQQMGFICVHRSYLVNMRHIRQFVDRDIIMSNGDVIPIGTKNAIVKDVKQQYFKFLEGE